MSFSLLNIFLIFIIALLSSLLILLLFLSPGKVKPYLDKDGKVLPNSISEKIFVDINGVKQAMFIKGKDSTKPVLLYLHGGLPDYFLTHKYPVGLDDHFVVVWWDQRGSGLSYNQNLPPESLTSDQLIADTIEVTKYLRQRFNQEKIYLMGHSGGTFIGIQAVSQAPQLYHAYIAVAQISNQLKSEKLAYDYMLKQFKENGNIKMFHKLEDSPVSINEKPSLSYLAIRDQAMHILGVGTMHNMNSVFTGVFVPSLLFPEYTLKEKIYFWRAKASSGVSPIWETILDTDLSEEISSLEIPVYFFHGIYDYTVSYSEAKRFFNTIHTPLKAFYTFQDSAHSPFFEEPSMFQKILVEDVLNSRQLFSDQQ